MYEEEQTEENKDDRNICPQCGLRQYGNTCSSCYVDLSEEDPDQKKEDTDDEYDYRERR